MSPEPTLPEGRLEWTSFAAGLPHDGVRSRRLDSEALTLIRYEFAPRASYPPHEHEHEHFIHAVDGRATIRLGGNALEVRPGDVVRVPAGVTHGITAGETGATLLNVGPRRS
jgi:quercetin dioxygenase-like cupin family protein